MPSFLEKHCIVDFIAADQFGVADPVGSPQYPQLLTRRIDARDHNLQNNLQPATGARLGDEGLTFAPRQLLDLDRPAPFEFSNLLLQIRQPGMTSFAH